MTAQLRFVDLFAGLGGFHLALARLGYQCVYACELDPDLRDLYAQNFAISPASDIRRVRASAIPHHDILCAGFPCQPFSKAGDQVGLDCPEQGDLFTYVARILRHHRPGYLILENVPNLLRHDDGGTYAFMRSKLQGLGYDVREALFSPHHFGIPQIRERAYIVGRLGHLSGFKWPEKRSAPTTIKWALECDPLDAKKLSPESVRVIEAWQEFLDLFPENEDLPSFPIWTAEFGASYPYEEKTPHAAGSRVLASCRGTHGTPLRHLAPADRMSGLPSYARGKRKRFPKWKVDFIRQNRDLYARHKRWIDKWLPCISGFHASHQKFEWNCKGENRDVWRYILQFRASGLRVKRPTTAPSLIAMTTTQVPIVAWERRYMTPRECAKLQSLSDLKSLPESSARAYRALGNAVNADVVQIIAQALVTSMPPSLLKVRKQKPVEQGVAA
jgi:DNA (cytosine-5)-methyltransferase 1